MDYIGQNRIRVPEKGRTDWDIPLNRNWRLLQVYSEVIADGSVRVISGLDATLVNFTLTIDSGVVSRAGYLQNVSGDAVTLPDDTDTWVWVDEDGVIQSGTTMPPAGSVPLYMAPIETGVVSGGDQVCDLRVFLSLPGLAAGQRKNLIINGCARINQRYGHGNTATTFVNTSGYIADRVKAGCLAGSASIRYNTTAATGFNSRPAFSAVVMTAVAASLGASDNYYPFLYAFEGADIALIRKFGITVSFTVNTNISGEFCVALRADSLSLSYVATVQITAGLARYSVTIPANNSLTITPDNSAGARLIIGGVAGSVNTAPSTNEWVSGLYFTSAGAVNWGNTISNYVMLQDVQVEVGDQATSIEFRDYAEELALCQRYYQQSPLDGGAFNITAGAMGSHAHNTYTLQWSQHLFRCVMRTTPTIKLYSPNTGNVGYIYNSNAGTDIASSLNTSNPMGFRLTMNNNGIAGNFHMYHYSADADF